MLGLLREERDASKEPKDLNNMYHQQLEGDIRNRIEGPRSRHREG